MADRPARRRFGCVEWGCLGAVLLAAVVVMLPFAMRGTSDHPHVVSCRSNVKQLWVAMAMYAQDWDQRLPHAQTWAPALKPYVGRTGDALLKPYHCPEDLRTSHDRGDGLPFPPSYAMMPRWSLHHFAGPDYAQTVLLLYEVGPAGPAYRHKDGMNVALGDGIVKWLSKSEFSPQVMQSGLYRPSPRK